MIKEKINGIITIIIEDAWMCLCQQDSEYALDPKCAKMLNMGKYCMAGFLICEHYIASEYAQICLDRVLNTSWVLNMPGFWIRQGSEYARVTQDSKYATIWLYLDRTWICLYDNRQGSEYV